MRHIYLFLLFYYYLVIDYLFSHIYLCAAFGSGVSAIYLYVLNIYITL